MNAYEKHAHIRPLWHLAITWSNEDLPGTVKTRERQIKDSGVRPLVYGSRSIKSIRMAVESAAHDLRAEKTTARLKRNKLRSRNGQRRDGRGVERFHGTLSDRLEAHRKEAVMDCIRGRYRFDETPEILLTYIPRAVGVTLDEILDWDYYSKATRYPKKRVYAKIKVPVRWITRVQKRGLGVINGMMTLDVKQAVNANGFEMYPAVWLKQGRGYALTAEHGFIARKDCIEAHGETPHAAQRAVARRIKAGQRKAA